MISTVSDLVFALFVIALASTVVFSFILVVKRFILTSFSPKEVASLALVSFLMGIMLEAYLTGDTSAEALASIIILLGAAWLIYRAIKRGWAWNKTKEEYNGGRQ